eukprot:674839-Pleurochrysis_carterae.AAC.6
MPSLIVPGAIPIPGLGAPPAAPAGIGCIGGRGGNADAGGRGCIAQRWAPAQLCGSSLEDRDLRAPTMAAAVWDTTQDDHHMKHFVVNINFQNTNVTASGIQSGNNGSLLQLDCGPDAMMAAFSPRVGADCSCVPERTRRTVLFNRVPKCGSSTFEKIIDRQSRRHRFQFVRSHDFVNNSISESEQLSLAHYVDELGRRQRVWRLGKAVLYDRHVFFVDFSKLGVRPPLYINLVRDPLKMQVSAFYFWKDCMCRMHKDFCRSAWQDSDSRACKLTMDEGACAAVLL